MTHEDVFLQDILENREDDTPRRIYADWLLDHHDPVNVARGELIHLQCDLARLPAGAERLGELLQRERELLEAHAREWGSHFGRLGCTCWEFRRGFVEGVGLPAAAFLAQAAVLFRAAPIHELKLYQVGSTLAEISSSPYLARVRTLYVENNDLGDSDNEALAGSAHLGELETLHLWCNHIVDPGVQALAGGRLPRLRRLDLAGNTVGDAGAATLASSPLLRGLAMLDLTGNQITDAGAQALAASPHAAGIAWLELAKNPITAAGQNILRERFAGRVHVWG
jgi:uncharacterized protein (TIGR02996 family)